MSRGVYITFSGGAALGDQIAGAGEEAENILRERAAELALEFSVLGYAGASVGGLLAILRAFGVGYSRIRVLFEELLYENAMLDFSVEGIPGGAVTKWEVLKDVCARELGAKTTFGDAPLPLVVGTTSADTGEPFYFSKAHTPKVLIGEVATRTSAFLMPITDMDSVPSLGTELTPDIRLFYDSGWTDNTCDAVFDKKPSPRVAIRLDRRGIQRVRKGDYLAMLRSYGRAALYASSDWKTKRDDGVNINLPVVYETGFDFSKTPDQIEKEWALGREQVLARKADFDKLFS